MYPQNYENQSTPTFLERNPCGGRRAPKAVAPTDPHSAALHRTYHDWSLMVHLREEIGAALRTKNKVNPVFISPGHLIDLPTAIDLTLRCDGGYRLPEPTRRAHLFVNALRRQHLPPTL